MMKLKTRFSYLAKTLRNVAAFVIVGGALPVAFANNFPLQNLQPFYFQVVGLPDAELMRLGSSFWPGVALQFAPNVRVTGGAYDAPPNRFGTYSVPSRLVAMYNDSDRDSSVGYTFLGYRDAVCSGSATTIPAAPTAGSTVTYAQRNWIKFSNQTIYNEYDKCDGGLFPPNLPKLTAHEDHTFNASVRRKASDGGQYDASPMVVTRNGVPWITYYWAYRVGLVANESNWNDANASRVPELVNFFQVPSAANNFELAALPSPFVEDEIIEYVNRVNFPLQPGGQYFYAVRAEDKTLLDSIPAWQRSGKSFKSGGYVSACRFYGGKNGGPNTHFYSADDKECALLKTNPQLSYEGQTFAVNMPLPGAAVDGVKPCPIDSKPLYRVYNNASASNGRFVSNHRYFAERADVATVVAQGWLDEGQVMCVPL